MKKIGAITIGQAPRDDVTADIMGILGDVELLQAGGLDGLTREDIKAFAPQEGDYVLVSRLNDGSSVTFAERHIIPRLQQCIKNLEAQGVNIIMVFCTGDFPEFESSVPLILPCKLLNGLVPALASSIAVIIPAPEQTRQMEDKWKPHVRKVVCVPATPYGDPKELEEAAAKIKGMSGIDLIVLDCIGYTVAMKNRVAEVTGKNVVLSRTLLAHVVAGLIY
jgi:protein AroM